MAFMLEIISPYLVRADELEWFSSIIPLLMASLIIALVLGFASKIGLNIIKNISQMREAVNSIKPKPKSLKSLALAEEAADNELASLANDYGADRACIMLFHNGKTSLGNIHLLSASIKAEGGSGRFPRISGVIQSFPLSTYGQWTKSIITGHGIEALDAPAMASSEAPDAYLLLEQNSVKSLYAYPVVTPSGEIDGCVFLEYCMSRRELGDTEKAAIRARGQSIYTKLHEANNV
jgi:hypothetical protein